MAASRQKATALVSRLLAHRVILLPRSNWVALGANRASTLVGRTNGLIDTRRRI